MRSPAQRFPDVASAAESPRAGGSTEAGASGSPNALSRGFAPGGAENARPLNANGMLQLVMQLLERLLQAIQSMFSGGASQTGSDGDGCGAGGQGTSGNSGTSGGCGGSGASGSSGAGSSGGTGSAGGSTQPGPAQGGTAPVPPRATSPPSAPPMSHPAALPYASRLNGRCGANGAGRGHGGLGRLLAGFRNPKVLRGAASAAANIALPGSSLAFDAGSVLARRREPRPVSGGACSGAAPAPPGSGSASPASSTSTGGGSLEDQIFAFFSKLMQQVEGELKNAMAQQDSQGAGGGDSRSAVAQKVQQLIQKRNEMVEMLTNSLKTLHETSMAVNRNIK
jgi:hypothetical protein